MLIDHTIVLHYHVQSARRGSPIIPTQFLLLTHCSLCPLIFTVAFTKARYQIFLMRELVLVLLNGAELVRRSLPTHSGVIFMVKEA